MVADAKKYAMAKAMLETYAKAINTDPANYPSAALASLMFAYEPVFIKSKKSNLQRVDTNEIHYPFVYKYVYDIDVYLACKINSCFRYDQTFSVVKKAIESLLGKGK